MQLLLLLFCARIVASRCIELTDGRVVCDDGDTMLPEVMVLAVIVPMCIFVCWCMPWNLYTQIPVAKTPV